MASDGIDPEVEARAALLMRLRRSGIRSLLVLRAMESVPRGFFAGGDQAALAARDIALPIACGQTMDRPSTVARRLEALQCEGEETVLEIGAGSGYVTALLARMGCRVEGVERFRRLAASADDRLRRLGLATATVGWGNGFAPWPGRAFDRILVHVALEAAPAALAGALRPGGLMVYTRGQGTGQSLVRAAVGPAGGFDETDLGPTRAEAAIPGRSAVL